MFLITADKSDKVMSLETADLLFLGGPIVNVYIIFKETDANKICMVQKMKWQMSVK